MQVIKVNNLTKIFNVKNKEKGFMNNVNSLFRPKYNLIKAVDDISFDVHKGEMIAFIGPNGAGKSTTIKMLSGILCPTTGNIKVCGLDPVKDRKLLSYKIGTLFGQKEQLWIHLTPYDNLKFFAAIYEIPDKIFEARINSLIKRLSLEDLLNVPVKNLSLGQRIKCEIAVSFIHNPEVLFLDEFTIGLDPAIKEDVRNLVKSMNKQYKTTIFLTSHDIGDINSLCKRIIIINKGKVLIDKTIEDLKQHYLNKKFLTIKGVDSTKFKSLPGINILIENNFSTKLEINTDIMTVPKVLELLNENNVQDIEFESFSLEKIITDIYKKEY